jgi:predicted SprT family Zn-dependent metalloprotease
VTVNDSDERTSDELPFRKPLAPVSAKKASAKKTPKPRTQSANSESDVHSTPKSQKSIPKSASKATPSTTPKYLEICDPDTPSEESSEEDEDFNPNDTWNASSDEDYDSESERIKKRNTIRQSMRFAEELTFVRDESIIEQKKLELLLEKYEFTKPPQIGDTKKKSKRKLFTHSHYEEEEENEIATKVDGKENEIPKDFKWPTPPRKEVKKVETTPIVRKAATPKLTPKLTPRELQKNFGPLSFLKSLDAEANRSLCDPDAIYYRNNYKTKKQELAEKLFKLYNEKVFNSQLTNVPMKWNKKLLNTAGRCNNSRRNGVRQSALELSDKVLTSGDRLRCTLIHEMCHAAAWILNGENGHGVVWKRWAAKANSTFPELPKISVCHDYIIEYRYTYLCINCKAQSKTHSKSKKVEEIQCSICKGSIKLFENKKNKEGQVEMVPVEKKEVTGKKIILY